MLQLADVERGTTLRGLKQGKLNGVFKAFDEAEPGCCFNHRGVRRGAWNPAYFLRRLHLLVVNSIRIRWV